MLTLILLAVTAVAIVALGLAFTLHLAKAADVAHREALAHQARIRQRDRTLAAVPAPRYRRS